MHKFDNYSTFYRANLPVLRESVISHATAGHRKQHHSYPTGKPAPLLLSFEGHHFALTISPEDTSETLHSAIQLHCNLVPNSYALAIVPNLHRNYSYRHFYLAGNPLQQQLVAGLPRDVYTHSQMSFCPILLEPLLASYRIRYEILPVPFMLQSVVGNHSIVSLCPHLQLGGILEHKRPHATANMKESKIDIDKSKVNPLPKIPKGLIPDAVVGVSQSKDSVFIHKSISDRNLTTAKEAEAYSLWVYNRDILQRSRNVWLPVVNKHNQYVSPSISIAQSVRTRFHTVFNDTILQLQPQLGEHPMSESRSRTTRTQNGIVNTAAPAVASQKPSYHKLQKTQHFVCACNMLYDSCIACQPQQHVRCDACSLGFCSTCTLSSGRCHICYRWYCNVFTDDLVQCEMCDKSFCRSCCISSLADGSFRSCQSCTRIWCIDCLAGSQEQMECNVVQSPIPLPLQRSPAMKAASLSPLPPVPIKDGMENMIRSNSGFTTKGRRGVFMPIFCTCDDCGRYKCYDCIHTENWEPQPCIKCGSAVPEAILSQWVVASEREYKPKSEKNNKKKPKRKKNSESENGNENASHNSTVESKTQSTERKSTPKTNKKKKKNRKKKSKKEKGVECLMMPSVDDDLGFDAIAMLWNVFLTATCTCNASKNTCFHHTSSPLLLRALICRRNLLVGESAVSVYFHQLLCLIQKIQLLAQQIVENPTSTPSGVTSSTEEAIIIPSTFFGSEQHSPTRSVRKATHDTLKNKISLAAGQEEKSKEEDKLNALDDKLLFKPFWNIPVVWPPDGKPTTHGAVKPLVDLKVPKLASISEDSPFPKITPKLQDEKIQIPAVSYCLPLMMPYFGPAIEKWCRNTKQQKSKIEESKIEESKIEESIPLPVVTPLNQVTLKELKIWVLRVEQMGIGEIAFRLHGPVCSSVNWMECDFIYTKTTITETHRHLLHLRNEALMWLREQVARYCGFCKLVIPRTSTTYCTCNRCHGLEYCSVEHRVLHIPHHNISCVPLHSRIACYV